MECEVCHSNLVKALASPRLKLLLSTLQSTPPPPSYAALATIPSSSPTDSPVPPSSPGPFSFLLFDNVWATCRPCLSSGEEGRARAFVAAPPLSVVLCSNRIKSEAAAEEALVHELVHLFDLKVLGLDFSNCRQLGYSEVRANREAECRNGNYGGVFAGFCKNATTSTSCK